jgi:hypothetical protein
MWAGVLTWLDASPARFATAAWAVFAMAAAAAAGSALPFGKGRWWRNPAIFAALALLSILAFRWPMLCDNRELADPDESQMMSGALTLNQDPLYWKSVDGQTRGPIDDWPLLALLRVAGHLDYTGARCLGAILAWACVMCAWLALRHLFGDGWARLLVLPLLAVHAFSDFWNFVQYGSEHVTDALVALASWLLISALGPSLPVPNSRRLLLAGLALGAVPFAKLQGLPIVAWAAIFAACQISAAQHAGSRARFRALAALLAGLAAVPAIILLWIACSGIWQDFLSSYVMDNMRYAEARNFTWAQVPAKFLELCDLGPGSRPFFLGLVPAAFVLIALPCFSRWHRRAAVFAAGLALSSAYAAMAPGRMFPHYLQLIFFPAGLLAGVAVGAAIDAVGRMASPRPALRGLAQAAIAIGFLACGLVPQMTWRAREVQASQGRFTATRGRLERSAVADEILRHAHAGERLGIWGWGPKFWIQTGLVQATRDGNTSRQIDDSRNAYGYYRDRYMSDLRQIRPPVLIDAVGDGNFSFHDRFASGHEIFNELNDYVRLNYRLVGDIEGTRIYVRNDLP